MKAFFRKLRSGISRFPYYQKVLFSAIGAVLLFLVIIGLIKFGNLLSFVLVYSWLAGEISEASGLNIWLVRALAVPLAVLVVTTIGLCLSFSKQKRQTGIVILAVLALISFLAMFLITQDQFFQRTTGEPIKYYAKTLDGYVISDSPGYDTKYGIKLEAVTPEIAKDIHAAQGKVEVAKDRDVFFSPTTGEPVKWYCRLDDGSIEIFSQPGFHPKTGKPLEPLTLVVMEYLKKEAEEQQRQQAEVERKQKEAEEQQRQQAEVERKQKEAEEQQRQQAEAEAEAKAKAEQIEEQKRKAAEEEQHRQAEAKQAIAVRTLSKLDRSLTPQQVLDATGRRQHINQSVVAAMPSQGKGVEENVVVEFFKLDRIVSNNNLAREYKERGLTPDPYAQARVNADDPAFADEHPNSTYWKDADGNWCFATFCRNDDERIVHICHGSDGWNATGGWWFGGVRKGEEKFKEERFKKAIREVNQIILAQEDEERQRQQAEAEKNPIITDWQIFWQKLGIKADLSAVKIPEHSPEFSRILIIPQGLTLNQVARFCEDRFSVFAYYSNWDDVDKAIVTNDRLPTQTYAVRLRERQEADEELENLSAIALVEKKIAGITLLERLVYELKYFDESGDHLDNNVTSTLCSGSRFADDDSRVPIVYWNGGHLYVYWEHCYDTPSGLRARAVVP